MGVQQVQDGGKMPELDSSAIGSSSLTNVKSLEDHPAYLKEGVKRLLVPVECVSWDVSFPLYDALEQAPYTHSAVIGEYEKNGDSGWAAAPDAKATPENAKSYVENIVVDGNGEMLCPGGRTGIKQGRGLLGKPGPNFAADPVIFRINPESNDLEVLLIERKDTGNMAIPGGMVDYGEMITGTLKRELKEETDLDISMDDATIVYKGYVDDPRNTDHAWMETTVATKLLSTRERSNMKIQAGDDARSVEWVSIQNDGVKNLYASHSDFVEKSLKALLKSESGIPTEVKAQIEEFFAS